MVLFCFAILKNQEIKNGCTKNCEQTEKTKHSNSNWNNNPEPPNLPLIYLKHEAPTIQTTTNSCAKFPDLLDLHFNNNYWQETTTSDGTFLLYGAYLDVRAANRLGPTIRLLGMISRLRPKLKMFCKLWFKNPNQPIISPVVEYKYIWYKKWGNYKQDTFQPYLISCQLPETHWGKVPSSVSLVQNHCEIATSNLRIIFNKPLKDKKHFAVCVKGLAFPEDDISLKLIEWIELLRILGADKIFFYIISVHRNVEKVQQR